MPEIKFVSDSLAGLINQAREFANLATVELHREVLNLHDISGVPANATAAEIVGDMLVTRTPVIAVEQPEVPGQPDASGLDKAGFPWDARIHSGGKSMNADGTWRYKKGADKAVIQSIEAELSSRLNAVVAAPPAPAPVAVAAPPAPAPVAVAAPPAPAPVAVAAPPAPAPVAAPPAPAPVAAPPAPAPVAAPPAPAPVAAGGTTPATIVNLISTLKLDVPTAVLPVLNNFGLSTLPELFQPQAAPMLGAIYAALGGQ